ncbi:MAG: hypothetical protein Q4E87_06000 [bacterium]|nr:hypothetical protein [bacterium]
MTGLTTQDDLFRAVQNTDYEDVRISAVKRITDQRSLSTILEAVRFSDTVKGIALASITNQNYLADVAIAGKTTEKYAMLAVRGISQQPLLYKCASETKYENVALFCVDKLSDEDLLRKVVLSGRGSVRFRERVLAKIKNEASLCDIVLRCSDDWVQKAIVPRITESAAACRIIVMPEMSNELKLLLVDRISEEQFLVECVKKQSFPEVVRRKCLNKLGSETSYVSLLKHSPLLEDWVIACSIRHVSGSDTLVSTVLKNGFSEGNRRLACSKLRNAIEFEQLFEKGLDDLPIACSIGKLSADYIVSMCGQMAILRNFRMVKDDSLKNSLLVLMTGETLSELYRKSDQVQIAKAVAALPSDKVLAVARRALFDVDVILDLALGKLSNDDQVARWALDLSHREEVLVQVALNAKKRALRMTAVARLSRESEAALNELAQDVDVGVRNIALERLRVLGGDKVVEFERKAKMERLREEALEKRMVEEQKAQDDHEKNDFECRYLSEAGVAQLSIIRKYIELNGKVHIESPVFRVTGRVAESTGRDLVLRVCSENGDVRVGIEMLRNSKAAFHKNEIVTISGYDNESTDEKIKLRCGELIERGIKLE